MGEYQPRMYIRDGTGLPASLPKDLLVALSEKRGQRHGKIGWCNERNASEQDHVENAILTAGPMQSIAEVSASKCLRNDLVPSPPAPGPVLYTPPPPSCPAARPNTLLPFQHSPPGSSCLPLQCTLVLRSGQAPHNAMAPNAGKVLPNVPWQPLYCKRLCQERDKECTGPTVPQLCAQTHLSSSSFRKTMPSCTKRRLPTDFWTG